MTNANNIIKTPEPSPYKDADVKANRSGKTPGKIRDQERDK
jgi:hypothetical protein